MGIVCIRALSVLHCKTLWHHHHFYVCVYKNNSMDHNQVWARVYRNSKPALTYAWKLCDSQQSNKHYRNMCDSHYCITKFFFSGYVWNLSKLKLRSFCFEDFSNYLFCWHRSFDEKVRITWLLTYFSFFYNQ